MLKHDITLLGYLDNGLGFYLFSYDGSEKLRETLASRVRLAKRVSATVLRTAPKDNIAQANPPSD
jgi:hypothetical protein